VIGRRVTPRRGTARLVAGALVTGVLLLLGALPAAADPAGPTNYTSSVTSVEPDVGGVTFDVLGGDAYVEVTVAPGSTVAVDGYDGEPYLRVLPDGRVERNEASPTRWLNDARYGAADTTVPPEASSDAPPRWEAVAAGGTYAWHDHRVHWMSPELPPNVDPGAGAAQPVTAWELPVTVDGEDVVVRGELVWLPPVSPIPAVVTVLLVAALGVALLLRRPVLAPVVTVVGAVAAGVVGLAGRLGLPPGADSDPAHLLLPAVSLALVGVGYAVRSRPGIGPALVGALAGVPLLVFSLLLVRALTAPIVPTSLPDLVARLLVGVVLGAAVASLVAAGRALAGPGPGTTDGRTVTSAA
jgi:hypothetical protein